MADVTEMLAGKFYADASHFASESGNFEVQRTNHFEVVLDLGKLGLSGGQGDVLSEHIRLSTKSISAPKVSSEQLELRHGNDVVKVAKSPSFDDLTLTVHDTIGRDQIDVMQQWFNRVFSRESKLMGMVSAYKTNGVLYMYSPDCSLIRKWNLEGIWPKSFGVGSEFSFDGTGDGQTITVELSVDRYFEDSGV